LKCRKYLNIKKKDTKIQTPDLKDIMMNPGKSKPINGKIEVETIPDQTQNQIIRIL
jgi:hypothetical protein